ncbi:MAG: phenylalanine--tRNA ligase subunit beta [Eubacterium sp.]|nr:phenylalanine--tRNA ligase subunit beta [Eubacterium sp.]
MNTPLSWIKAYVPDLDVTPEEFVDRITLSGSHVENYKKYNKNLDKIVVGHILSIERHPDADKLVICKVDVGQEEPIQIVTGAPNVKEGDLVPTVLDGGRVAGGHDGGELPPDGIRIKKGKLRGVESFGMMCAIEELGSSRELYPEAPEDGVYVFPADAGVKPGDDAIHALGLDDTNVEYEITSNRVDCFSIIGMAREAAVTFDKPLHLPEVTVKEESEEKTEDYIKVTIQDPDLCKRYIARVVKDIKIGPSPKWMQQRLRSQGIRPINNIVDITNYVMEEYGQPMHAFDLSTIAKNEIIVRRAADGDVFKTLDGVERTLDKDVLMICDGEKEVAIGGIMGGENSMVTDTMTTLLFEAACFDGTNIRLSERRLGLRTDAAGKFEKGLDPNLAEEAINRACQLIEEMNCGTVLKGAVDVYPNPVAPKVLPFEPEKMNRLLGLSVPEATMLHYFHSLGLSYNEEKRELTIPTFRQDLNCMADLAEEVARFYGYDKIPSTLTTVSAGIGGLPYHRQIQGVVRTVVEACGFSGGMNYSFESPKVFDKLLLPADHPLRAAIRISNPLGEDFSIMRTTTLSGMMTSLATNFNRRNKNVRLYELGNVYIPHSLPLTELPDEKLKLTLGMYGDGDFFTLKGVVEELFDHLKFEKDVEFVPVKDYPFLHPGRQAEIRKGELLIGYIGQVHPEVVENYDMKGDCFAAVLDMETVTSLARFDIKYIGVAKFPGASRDLALVADKSVLSGDIEKVIRKCGGALLETVSLFDIYEGEQLGEGKKSLAYSLLFRASDRTLSDAEVNEKIDKILAGLEKIGVSLRR